MRPRRPLGAFVGVALLVTALASPDALGQAAADPPPQNPPIYQDSTVGEAHSFSTAAARAVPFTVFGCSFEVPATPVTLMGQSIFPWCGIQQSSGVTPTGDTSFGVLQPVLMFGSDCVSEDIGLGPFVDPSYLQDPYWYYSAQYVFPDPIGSLTYSCHTGPGFKAQPGDVLISTFTYDPVADTMTVAMSQQDGSGLTTFVAANPWLDPTASWSSFVGQTDLEMSIEAWKFTGPDSWPATPPSWPVTMTYEGTAPEEFVPFSWGNGLPSVTCDTPTVSGSTATAVCTYDLTSTQSGGTSPTDGGDADPPAGPVPIPPGATATPRFTG